MTINEEKIVEDTPDQPKVEYVVMMPQQAYRFRVKFYTGRQHYDDALCRQVKSVSYSLLDKTITLEMYETDHGTVAHALSEFMRCGGNFQIEGIRDPMQQEPLYKLSPTRLKMIEHNTILDYADKGLQMHKLKFEFLSLDLI